MPEKLFVGPQVRALRLEQGLNLEACAARLHISVSYLSQIESNQRPVTARVLVALVEQFGAGAAGLEANEGQRLVLDLREAIAETDSPHSHVGLPEVRQVAIQAPSLARRFLDLHRANQRLTERLNLTEAAVALDEETAASSLLPYEEVREFFHDKDNYIDTLDRAAEALAAELDDAGQGAHLEGVVQARLGVTVARTASGDVMRSYDRVARRLTVNGSLPLETQAFQIAYHLVAAELSEIIEAEVRKARFRTVEAADLCRIGLGNYAASALIMPYQAFADAARGLRHDVEALALRFGASLEQVCHRLSTLQRPGRAGLPVYFIRLDAAGNITKRHSATRLRFARFGGSCPLWNVHEAAGAPDRFLVQVAEMPDGARYLSVARSVLKPSGSYLTPARRYVLGFGCEISQAHELVYAEGLDLKGPAARIGISCRICERNDCAQRAFPPVDRRLTVPTDERRTVPFRLG